MSYLLDTNIISETIRPQPNKNVSRWFKSVSSEPLFISVLTFGEIRKGIERLQDGKRKEQLVLWVEQDLYQWFGKNIIEIDVKIAECWGRITCFQNQSNLTAIDTLIAATALTYNLKIVTRNIKDFNIPGLECLNPFE